MDKQKTSLAEWLNMYKNYENVLDDIKKYNRADTVNMSEDEMNKFRHIAGPAYLSSRYYPEWITTGLGYGKEIKDLFQNRGFPDTNFDLGNNQIGINVGLANRNVKGTQKDLFDYVFKTYIEPYRK